ncbi:tubulin-folding cofactor B [Cyclospora cayetanensis]|uniref:Tubulin-folding cofactor B n=1 Tax=Cyclospora cayetanensis TaxID=88456 RepID=A0A6P6RVB6_9EIME|nr:tubulin-folding cofactor B [Cyclospora cayetanensis]
MELQLILPAAADGRESATVPLIDADELSLRMFGCLPTGCTLVIIDSCAGSSFAAGGAADVAAAAAADGDADISKRYVMSDEVYDQRDESMRKFLRNLQAARPDLFEQPQKKEKEEEEQQQQKQQQQQQQQQQGTEQEIREKFTVGSRCVLIGDRRGQIAYVGRRQSRPPGEIWIGVALDEPLGRTDGRDFKIVSAAVPAAAAGAAEAAGTGAGGRGCLVHTGKPLFACEGDRYGEFALPSEVTVGNFPPLDPFDLVDEI